MPGLLKPDAVEATINFGLRDHELDYDASIHQREFKARPSGAHRIALINLKPELEAGTLPPAAQQLEESGFAVVKSPSATIATAKDTQDAITAYLEESRLMMKELLGAKDCFVWNSVYRFNQGPVKIKEDDTRQYTPVPKRVPATDPQPTSLQTHVDQDAPNGLRICKACAGEDVVAGASRVQIVNLWRPIGLVTNAPLAYCDYRSLAKDDVTSHMGPFGGAILIHYSSGQKWSYIKRQTPDEAILLRCYDSWQGSQGGAPFSGHTACEKVDGEGPIEGEDKPRESIEIRFVVIH